MVRQTDDRDSNDSIPYASLQQTERLFWQGKLREALEQLDQLEAQENISETEWLKSQLLKCRIFADLDVKQAQEVATQVIMASQDLNQPLIRIDTLLIMAEMWLELSKLNASMHCIDQGKTLLTTLTCATTDDLTEREATLLTLEGGIYSLRGELKRALECLQHSLALRKKLGNPQEIAHSLFYLGEAYFFKGELDLALECVQQSLTLRKQLEHPHDIAHLLFSLGRLYSHKGEKERALKYFQQSLGIREQLGAQHAIADSLSWIALVYTENGEFKHALEVVRTSLDICEKLGITGTCAENRCFLILGGLDMLRGELDHGLEYFQKFLLNAEEQGVKTDIAMAHYNISFTYFMKGKFESARDYMEKSLKIHEDIGDEFGTILNLIDLTRISLEMENLESARHYVRRLELLQNKVTGLYVAQGYDISRARLLKTSPRLRDKMKAQVIFQQISEDKVINMNVTVPASLNLCELLFFEFKTSADPAILHEIQTVTNRLLDIAQKQHSHVIFAETYLLQAKLALLELDVPRARQLLTQAQAIADEKGFEKLAWTISHEHDVLLRQLDRWETLGTQETSPTEVDELAGVEELLTRMTHQRVIDPPKVQPEEPVLLLIITEGGLTLFSHPFEDTHHLKEQLIGGFLTALSAFGQDALATSGTIDRIVYAEYTVAVKALEGLLFCYIFQGPSYLALQKLEKFIDRIRADTMHWQPLNDARKIGRVIAPNSLEALIGEVFHSS